mmetsp:Transcript_17028/g.28774  ORF Transcript_17028/g.28774 Transcript_17028/m.28774 type:complete len:163 (+) Transcript_17028:28-516(+)
MLQDKNYLNELVDFEGTPKIASEPKKQSKAWIGLSLLAAASFASGNSFITAIASQTNPINSIMYYSTGGLVCGLFYNFKSCLKNKKQGKGCWSDQNLVVDGKLKTKHVLGFIIQSLFYWSIKAMIFLNFRVSKLADINTGIISGIWNIVPLFMAILDYFIYG